MSPFGHQVSVFDFGSLKPDMMCGLGHGPLHHPQQPLMCLAHLPGKKEHLSYTLNNSTEKDFFFCFFSVRVFFFFFQKRNETPPTSE